MRSRASWATTVWVPPTDLGTHQNATWERTRHTLRLRSALKAFFPAAVQAFPDLAATDALILLGRAPGPVRAGRLTRGQVVGSVDTAVWEDGQATRCDDDDGALRSANPGGHRCPPAVRAYSPFASVLMTCLAIVDRRGSLLPGTSILMIRRPGSPAMRNNP